MPYVSKKQAGFVHAKANEGVPWARKFVRDAAGQLLRFLPRKVKKLSTKKRAAS